MSCPVSVYLLPSLIESGDLEGGVAVVVDVLRASTTIVHALAHGATGILPCESVEQAREAVAGLDRNRVLLGGERGGERINGFDLGNSPLEYSPDVVRGKTVVFTTTNGTKALRQCESAARVLIGTFVNRAALVRVLQTDGRPVHVVCAGTDGQLTAEDVLFAGSVAAEPGFAPTDVQTEMAIDYHLARSADQTVFRETIRSSRGGRNLLRLGMDADVERAAQLDLFDVVPEWSRRSNMISVNE